MSPSWSKEPEGEVLLDFVWFDHAEEIGQLVCAWARVEHEIDEAIWKLAGVEENPGACMTAQISNVARRFDALFALARLRQTPPELLRDLEKVKNEALKLAALRNRVVHDPWASSYTSLDDKKHYRLEVTARSKLDFRYKEVPTDALKRITESIKKLHERLHRAVGELDRAYWSSLEI